MNIYITLSLIHVSQTIQHVKNAFMYHIHVSQTIQHVKNAFMYHIHVSQMIQHVKNAFIFIIHLLLWTSFQTLRPTFCRMCIFNAVVSLLNNIPSNCSQSCHDPVYCHLFLFCSLIIRADGSLSKTCFVQHVDNGISE